MAPVASGSLELKFNAKVVIKSLIVGVLVSLCICVLRMNHGAFNEILRICNQQKNSKNPIFVYINKEKKCWKQELLFITEKISSDGGGVFIK